jgi:hypothetical protein
MDMQHLSQQAGSKQTDHGKRNFHTLHPLIGTLIASL